MLSGDIMDGQDRPRVGSWRVSIKHAPASIQHVPATSVEKSEPSDGGIPDLTDIMTQVDAKLASTSDEDRGPSPCHTMNRPKV